LTDAPDALEQAVIMVRGGGMRPGASISDAPQPPHGIGDRPVLDYLIETCLRLGFREILLLAEFEPEKVAAYVERARATLPGAHCVIGVAIDQNLFGTAGAIRCAADRLREQFLLLDDDSVLDTNWLDLTLATSSAPLAVMALRRVANAAHGTAVTVEGDRVTGFLEPGSAAAGTIAGGVYLLNRGILAHLPRQGSLEQIVLPDLAARGLVRGRVQEGLLLRIGGPRSPSEARSVLARLRHRPAVFFDRDGTLNTDDGYTHRPQDLAFLPGAIDAVKRVNDLGHYAFLVTNQSGVARGYFTEADVEAFNTHLQRKLRAAGAHVDDIRYCPDHPEGTVARYRRVSDWRKPAPGMLLDLMKRWPIRPEASLVVGDKDSDIAAARAAGLRGLLYTGGSLDDCLAPHLPPMTPASCHVVEP
jgi:D,D-heptose 1,7-bisphosphate phosphatase